MAQRHSTAFPGGQSPLLDHQPISNNGLSPGGKCVSVTSLEDAGHPAEPSPPLSIPRRVILSTESPAALKVGTQQLIPKSLAENPKSKLPARPQSFSDGVVGGREGVRCDPKRLSAPSLSLEDELEDELDAGEGTLKRNLRSLSYRAAMKDLKNGAGAEPVRAPEGLRPVLEDAKPPASRAPARNKVGEKDSGHKPPFSVAL